MEVLLHLGFGPQSKMLDVGAGLCRPHMFAALYLGISGEVIIVHLVGGLNGCCS